MNIKHWTVIQCAFLLAIMARNSVAETSDPTATFVVGVGTHGAPPPVGWHLLQQLGVDSVRDDIHWKLVEPTEGTFVMPARYDDYVNQLVAQGVRPLLILDYGHPLYDNGSYPVTDQAIQRFAEFATFVVEHFKGRVHSYEVWNEWNTKVGVPSGEGPGEPTAYVRLLRATYQAIKRGHPEVEVIGGVLAGTGDRRDWLRTACQSGMLDYLDAFSFHSYVFENTGKQFPEVGMRSQINAIRQVIQPYLKGRSLDWYITEFGWPNHDSPEGSTPEASAKYLARALLIGRTFPFLKGMWWYDWTDDGVNPVDKEDHFGLLRRDLSPKPTYFMLREIQRILRGSIYQSDRQTDAAHFIVRLQKADGELLAAIWNLVDESSTTATVSVSSVDQPPTATLEVPGSLPQEIAWNRGAPGQWSLTVHPTGTPLFLRLRAKDYDVAWTRVAN